MVHCHHELWQTNLARGSGELMSSFGDSWMLPAYLSQTSNNLLRKQGEDKPDQGGGSGGGRVTPRVLEYLSLPLGEGSSAAKASKALSLSLDHLSSGTGRDYLFNTHTGARRWL